MRSPLRPTFPAIVVFVACFCFSTSHAQPWLGGGTVGPSGIFGGHSATSLALDASQNSCVAYYEGTGGDLMFAQLVDGTWSIAPVDTVGDTGQYCALAIDSTGEPHIAYYWKNHTDGSAAEFLRYAWRSGGTWNTETLDGGVSGFTDLVLDSSDNPHITYFHGSSLSLKHAVKNGGSWTLETVDANGAVGPHATLAIDASDNLHVVYKDIDNRGIKYGVKSGGGWTLEPIAGLNVFPPMDLATAHTGLDLDSSGNAHVVFRNENTAKSMYAHNSSGSWTTEIARSLGQDLHGSFHVLQVGPGDVPTMTFFDDFWQELRLARFDGTWWIPQNLRPLALGSSLAIDNEGDAHISFHAFQTAEVQYVYESSVVSDAGPVATETRVSLAISPNPMLTSTTLFLRTPVSMTLGMEILDVRGRVIRSIAPRTHGPGLHDVSWDGRDDAGNAVGAGVYFAVSRPRNLFAPGKIVVVR